MTTAPLEPTSDPDLAPGHDEDEPTIDPTQPGEQVTEELPGSE